MKLEEEEFETSLESTGGHLAIVGSTAENNGYYLTLSSVGNGSYKILSATDNALCLRLPDGTATYGSAVPVGGSDSNSSLGWWVFEKAGSYMESTAEYTDDGNYLTKVTASDGSSTNYVYHPTKGTLTSVAEPGNVTTNYTYDANNDLLTKVEQGDAQVLYVYSNRKLAEITTPTGTKYSFAYDNFNQRIQTSIGSRILSTNTYDNMGRLQKTTYGNGHTVETTYDILSRATLLKYNGVEKVKYTYDNDGNVSQLVDLFGNLTTNFTYDSVKRLVLMTVTNGYRLRFTYDDKNRVSKMTESISGTGITNKTTDYTYDATGIIREVRNTQGNASFSVAYEFYDLYRVNSSSAR